MTVQEAWAWAQGELERAGLPEAWREAAVLLSACMGWERARLMAHPGAALTAAQQRRYACWVRRRTRREPLAYITRRVWFYGLELTVGRGALIPRPETELLVEVFLEWAQARAGVLVDAGTGSGAIAIACLTHAPHWRALGIDRSRRALHLAVLNRR
ncbi:MAG: methyltransferase, partial [Fimbriimonadales bacterium]|nr:methyltransferase [Fimbriimonadales bacterium]